MEQKLHTIIENFKKELTFDGKTRVFEDNEELRRDFLLTPAKPEDITLEFLIDPIITDILRLEKLPQINFKGIGKGGDRWVDYRLKNDATNQMILLEAKPINADLYNKKDGAIKQIKDVFRLAEVQRDYEFGIATDGIRWVFIDKNQRIFRNLDIRTHIDEIREIILGKEKVSVDRVEEEISKKFYNWYNALLHGGTYNDHENRKRKISNKNCLVNNISTVLNEEDREEIAQTVMDRLIFIKFLQSKKIIDTDVLGYLSELGENQINESLRMLFFNVLNTKKQERINVDKKFQNIPYLNGSLFIRTDEENKYPDYKIEATILKAVIEFLNSFKFVHTEALSNKKEIDPEILGYIFEKAMTAKDRKGTGSYYTPRIITKYISENTIYPLLIERTNKVLKERGYRESITEIDDLYKLNKPALDYIFKNLLPSIKICDNACGSGAFLLSIADYLLEIYERLNDILSIGNSQIELRKKILKNSVYGVDLNPKAIEIAKLRLWLWLVDAYEIDKIEPLPNIEYNIMTGNSLIGYTDINEFKEKKIHSLADWDEEIPLKLLLIEREDSIERYKISLGNEARELKKEIEKKDERIINILNKNLYREINQKQKLTEDEFKKIRPFHWAFQFYDVFNHNAENGFDIIIGNPPYGNILKPEEKKCMQDYKTIDNSEISANFIERSVKLLKKDAYLGFIVANSIAINRSTSSAREVIRHNMSISKMALFGTRPAKIFADAEIRVLIFLGKRDIPSKMGDILTTEAIKFTSSQRDTILSNLSFESSDGLYLGKYKIGDDLEDHSLPKVGNLTIRNILLKLKKKSDIILGDRINKKNFDKNMEFRKTGGYWLNALEKMPYRSTKIENVRFQTSVERDFSIILINSSLFYLYWSTYGNLRDFPPSLFKKFPIPALEVLKREEVKIEQLKNKITKCLLKCFIAERGRVGEFRTASCRSVIDSIDEFLGKMYDLNEKEIDFVKKYDKHIRK